MKAEGGIRKSKGKRQKAKGNTTLAVAATTGTSVTEKSFREGTVARERG
jgi:hypothetical protein